MRDGFAYESNALLLSQYLVPDPITRTEWTRLLTAWQSSHEGLTLMEWIVLSATLNEGDLLAILGNQLGCAVYRDTPAVTRPQNDSAALLLQRHGFLTLPPRGDKYLVAGGPTLAPDLTTYIGAKASQWEWVLVGPMRKETPLVAETVKESGTYAIGNWLRDLVQGLWSSGASDIHFEREEESLRVRYHKKGSMHTAGTWEDGRARAVTRLLATWAKLPPADVHAPRDGKISLATPGKSVELRVAILPTINGESVVIRSPDPLEQGKGLQELGMPHELIRVIMDKILHDPGLILCTGTTGSGKTTTLYGILRDLQHFPIKIITIEDPVEQTLPFAVQSPVDEEAGWTFARAIRAYLRQDPDVIMIGEIRDTASAAAACRAALTGHAVLATLHASNSKAAISRLGAWGIKAGMLTECIRLVIHQNLSHSRGTGRPVALFNFLDQTGMNELTT